MLETSAFKSLYGGQFTLSTQLMKQIACFLPSSFSFQSLGCKPIASLDHFTPEMMASAELVEEVPLGTSKVVKVTGIANPGRTVSILVRGSNKLVLEEAERSLHDALCVVRCLVKKR